MKPRTDKTQKQYKTEKPQKKRCRNRIDFFNKHFLYCIVRFFLFFKIDPDFYTFTLRNPGSNNEFGTLDCYFHSQ